MSTPHRRSVPIAGAAILLWLLVALPLATPGHAQVADGPTDGAEERIRDFEVTLAVSAAGDLEVIERITYDFDGAERHGILRDIPVRFHYDDDHDRVYPLAVIDVGSETGAPDDYTVEDIGDYRRIRVGDPDLTVSGAHIYVIRYQVQGVLNAFEEHDELYWNATGDGWDVPIDHVAVSVRMPAEVQQALCFAGAFGSNRSCDDAVIRARTVEFTHASLRPREGVTVVASIPTGVVPAPAPVLEERWSLQRAFTVTDMTIGITAALAAIVLALVIRTLWLVGRDRRWAGSVVDARFGSPAGDAERVPLFEGGPFPVEYSPPGDLRPGLIGTLRDEVAHPLDVTATIIDLATRGHLRIEEITTSGLLRDRTDWRLVRSDPAPHDTLQPYERLLLDALFEDGPEVELSSLRRKFRDRLESVQTALYKELVRRGWYRRSPRATRGRWLAVGLVSLAASVGLFVAAIAYTEWALIPIPLIVGSIALIAGHHATPARTPRGSAALRRIRGFERFVASAELYRTRFAEQERLFYDYLPYAVVFGLTEEWAKAFEGLADMPEAEWYVGTHPLHVALLADSITHFSQESTGVIAATPASSGSSGFSGGFAGGGAGGGGGGSW